MYYSWPRAEEAYEVPNEYEFGSELIVCPITAPADPSLRLGSAVGWLPEGLYFDFFTGFRYRGGRKLTFYRPLNEMPVFAKAGAIVPLTGKEEAEKNGVALPRQLQLLVFAGADGAFELYEDDGETDAYAMGRQAVTHFEFCWRCDKGSTLLIRPAVENSDLLPEGRRCTAVFVGVRNPRAVRIAVDGAPVDAKVWYDDARRAVCVSLPPLSRGTVIEVAVPGGFALAENPVQSLIFDRLNDLQISYELKEKIYRSLLQTENPEDAVCEWQTMGLPPALLGALTELLFAV